MFELTAIEQLQSGSECYTAAPVAMGAGHEMYAGILRSPHWAKVRVDHLDKEPCCAVCGSRVLLNVHHIKPFHLFPELELEDSNLITLCEGKVVNCHLLFGHRMNWRKWNPDVVKDAKAWCEKLAAS